MRTSRLRLRNVMEKRRQKSAGSVAALNFNVNNKQFNINRINADNQNSYIGVGGGMRVFVLHIALALRCLEPAAEHSAYFGEYALYLENFRFIRNMQFKHETYFIYANFKGAARFYEVACF